MVMCYLQPYQTSTGTGAVAFVHIPLKFDHFKYSIQVLKLRLSIQAWCMKFMWVHFNIIVPYFRAGVV